MQFCDTPDVNLSIGIITQEVENDHKRNIQTQRKAWLEILRDPNPFKLQAFWSERYIFRFVFQLFFSETLNVWLILGNRVVDLNLV